MKNLKYILLGITTGLVIVPLVDKLFEVLLLWLETFKIKSTSKILKSQKETTILREFTKSATPMPDYEMEYIYGDDDDDFEDLDE